MKLWGGFIVFLRAVGNTAYVLAWGHMLLNSVDDTNLHVEVDTLVCLSDDSTLQE